MGGHAFRLKDMSFYLSMSEQIRAGHPVAGKRRDGCANRRTRSGVKAGGWRARQERDWTKRGAYRIARTDRNEREAP